MRQQITKENFFCQFRDIIKEFNNKHLDETLFRQVLLF